MAEDFKHSFKTDRRGELSLLVYNVGFQKCPPGYGWGPGVRDHYLLHYVLSGQGTYETGGRTFVLHSGEAFLARPDVPIFYRADDRNPWEYYWVGFSGRAAPLLLAQTPFTAAWSGSCVPPRGISCGRGCWISTKPGGPITPPPCAWRDICRLLWVF